MGDGDADGGAAHEGFDHHGEGGVGHQGGNVLLGVGDPLPLGGVDAQGGHQAFGQVLIHGDGAAQVVRPGEGDAEGFQGGLDPAVLAAVAVEGQEHDVRLLAQLQHAYAEVALALPLAFCFDLLQIRCLTGDLLPSLGHGGVKEGFHGTVVPFQAHIEIH